MKKSTTRLSRTADTANVEASENVFLELFGNKWQDLLNEEETDMFILSLRDKIVHECLDECYQKYLDKQAILFAVHCAYLAWVKALDVYFMPRDESDSDNKETWEPDCEPNPSEIDSWASEAMPVIFKKPESKEAESKPTKETFVNSEDLNVSSPEVESTSSLSGMFDEGEGYLSIPGEAVDDFGDELIRKKSIFTRTLSMSRELLPTAEPDLMQKDCKEEILQSRMKSINDEIMFPEFLKATSLPHNRIDVQFAVVPDNKVAKKGSKK